MKKKTHAFTLIELLVVITIIAVLATLLAPAISGVMEGARAKDCGANLKSIGQGITQYLVDNRDSFFERGGSSDNVWPKALKKKYVQDWRSFRSPFDKVSSSRPKRDEDPVPISYGLNENLFDTFLGKWNAPKSSLILAAPAVEAIASPKPTFKADAVSTASVVVTAGGAGDDYGTHTDRTMINVLMCDGSMQEMTWKKYAENSSPKGQRQWDPFYEEP